MREQEIKKHLDKLNKKLQKNGEDIVDLLSNSEDLEIERGEIIVSMTHKNHNESMSKLKNIGKQVKSNEDKIDRRRKTRKNIFEDIENANKWEVTK